MQKCYSIIINSDQLIYSIMVNIFKQIFAMDVFIILFFNNLQ